MSLENSVFIKISRAMTLKYVGYQSLAKTSVKFRGSTREIPKDRSKFMKNAIFTFAGFLSINTIPLFSSCMGFVRDTEMHPK